MALTIAVIGAGKVGSSLARIWAAAGHRLILSSRDPAKLRGLAEEIGASIASPRDAVSAADTLLLAVPYGSVREALDSLPSLSGKTLIDATNPIGYSPAESGARSISELARGARVVKAFNTVFASMFPIVAANPGSASLLYCGDDAAAKEDVAVLIRAAGFVPVDAGDLSKASELEAFARLVISIAYERGRGPFTYLFGVPGEQPG
jgi:hypothetical protein